MTGGSEVPKIHGKSGKIPRARSDEDTLAGMECWHVFKMKAWAGIKSARSWE
jgi:hypothetical protein